MNNTELKIAQLGCSRIYSCQLFAVVVFLIVGLVSLPATANETSSQPSESGKLLFDEVQLSDIEALIEAVPKGHPRLLAAPEDFASLRDALADNTTTRGMLAHAVIHQADLQLDQPPIERKLQGRRLLGQSRRALARLINLSVAYQLTGDSKYVERGQQEMFAIADFSDWNPSHFLDVAEMTLALAIGYDWMYDALDDASRAKIRQAILSHGVTLPFETKYRGWVTASNNWGQVCHCGLTAGALAICEDEPQWAAKTVLSAVQNLPRSMAAFAPKGSYPEGPGYWSYGTSFNVVLLAMLDEILGSDFGLSKLAGFEQTGQYPALVTGPSGLTFNYADGGAGRHPEPALYWFAKRYQRPDWLFGEDSRLRDEAKRLLADQRGGGGHRLLPLALLWMDQQDRPLSAEQIQMPLSWQSESQTPIAIHRSSWTGMDAIFLGVKAGSPSAPHGHMDSGSFVLDADGQRWAMDLGAEGYHGIESRGMNLWSLAQDSDRWTIFRQSNASHNTLMIDDALQIAKGNAEIISFSDEAQYPHTIVDLSPVYVGQAEQIHRGFALLPSHEVLIQDQLTGLKPGSRVRWGMLTPATAASQTDRRINLERSGQQMTLTVVEPANAVWSIIQTDTPRNEWDSPNPGTRMVALECIAPEQGELRIVVVATPGSCLESVAEDLSVRSLEDW